MNLLLCIWNNHRMAGCDLEILKSWKGNWCLHFIPKLNKCNSRFCLNHANLLEAWELLEEHLDCQACSFMWQVLHKQKAVGWGRHLWYHRSRYLVLLLSLHGHYSLWLDAHSTFLDMISIWAKKIWEAQIISLHMDRTNNDPLRRQHIRWKEEALKSGLLQAAKKNLWLHRYMV